jgi:DNA modification methylase
MPTREVYEKFQEAAKNDAFRKDYDELRKGYDELRKDYDELRKDYDELRGYHNNEYGFTDIWEFDSLTTSDEHPTVKPLEVCQRGIKTNSREGEIVLDLFGGSGSTLIACEQTNRICYMMELDPKYTDVIRKRYYKFTHDNNEEGWQEGTPVIV